jgi:hypothetical protein
MRLRIQEVGVQYSLEWKSNSSPSKYQPLRRPIEIANLKAPNPPYEVRPAARASPARPRSNSSCRRRWGKARRPPPGSAAPGHALLLETTVSRQQATTRPAQAVPDQTQEHHAGYECQAEQCNLSNAIVGRRQTIKITSGKDQQAHQDSGTKAAFVGVPLRQPITNGTTNAAGRTSDVPLQFMIKRPRSQKRKVHVLQEEELAIRYPFHLPNGDGRLTRLVPPQGSDRTDLLLTATGDGAGSA